MDDYKSNNGYTIKIFQAIALFEIVFGRLCKLGLIGLKLHWNERVTIYVLNLLCL